MTNVLKSSEKSPAVVVIGGGTGSFTLLQSLKLLTPNITALVNMIDDGGSTGVLRDELGVLPPGDVRQCLVALSEAPQQLRDLFNFRFSGGTFAGHSFGNLFLSAVEKMTDNFADSVNMASELLRITGRVVPVTLDNCHMELEQDGRKITGEYNVGQTKLTSWPPKLSLTPKARLNPEAKVAIEQADLIVIAPGNLYGSLVPALLVEGIGEALQKSEAKVAFVCNLVSKQEQAPDFAVHEYAEQIEHFAGRPILDYVLYNTDMPSKELLEKYALEAEFPVLVDDGALGRAGYVTVPGSFLSHEVHRRDANDTRIKRSLIRHDGKAVAQCLFDIAVKE